MVDDCHGVKWYDYEDVIDLDEAPSLQWKFNNQFGDPFFPNSGFFVSRLDAWLMMYGGKYLLLYLTTPNWVCSGKAGDHLRTWPRRCGSKVW